MFDSKIFLLLALAISGTVHAVPEVDPLTGEVHDYMYFPDGDGIPQLIDLAETPASEEEIERNVNTVTFNLFTRQNPRNAQRLVLNNLASVSSSNWSHQRATRWIIHGWRNNVNSPACTTIRDAYLATGDYNVIVVDWGQIAGQVYVTAAGSVRNVAAHVGQMITFMNRAGGMNYQTTQTIGHSLGGHIAGLSARAAAGTLAAVVALDPALPSFNNGGAGTRVDSSDASHVQVIHTNGGLLGIMNAIGDSDFYPNGGRSQPGCGNDLAGTCAHSRAYYYFAESIQRNNFRAANNIFMGGRWLSTHARGSFQLETNAQAPFGRG